MSWLRFPFVLVSPAYGRIEHIEKTPSTTTISIFLTLFDNHDQFFPCDGYVKKQVYDPTGVFRLVLKGRKSDNNEKAIHVILNHLNDDITVHQIAGFFYRRITYEPKQNHFCRRGEYLGNIHMGRRVDITFPSFYHLYPIKVGMNVRGGETPLAERR